MTAFTLIPLFVRNVPYIRHCRHFRHKKRAGCRQLRFCFVLFLSKQNRADAKHTTTLRVSVVELLSFCVIRNCERELNRYNSLNMLLNQAVENFAY
jgi:hypothetical protein